MVSNSRYWLTALLGILFPSAVHAFRRTPSSFATTNDATVTDGDTANTEYANNDADAPRRRNKAVMVDVPTDPASHLVTDLPLLDKNALADTPHWAGHLPVTGGRQGDGDKYLFYWLFAPSSQEAAAEAHDDAPLIIWLNGGPACSSMDGLFIENGPMQWQVDPSTKEYKLVENPYSWHNTPAYTLYIDQPVGTGLSFTTSKTYPRNDEQVNVDFFAFLQNFFALHADKFVTNGKVNRDVYFSGESHAGHYIPSMMNYILQQNDKNQAENIQIPLAGAAIGNGWVDPYHQYAAAAAAFGHGIIDESQLFSFNEKELQCQKALERGQYTFRTCYNLLDDIVDQSYGSKSPYKVSQYDVRRSESKHGHRDFPPGYKITEAYLGAWPLGTTEAGSLDVRIQTAVLEAIHASAATVAGQRYQECTDPPYNALSHQDGLGVVDDVVAVLHHASKPRLLFFNGIEDLICNHVGNERFLEHLPWEHRDEWMEATRYAWSAGKATQETPAAGYMKEFDNLLFLKLFNSGHMVPLDVPDIALNMMQVLTKKESFQNSEQHLGSALAPPGQDTPTPDCPVCPTCPTCEKCPAPSIADDDVVEKKSANQDMMTMLGPLLGVVGLVSLAWSCKRNRRMKKVVRANGMPPVNDLELRERKTYHDDDVLDDEKEFL